MPRTNHCDLCSKDFSTQSSLSRHFRNIHPDESTKLVNLQKYSQNEANVGDFSTYIFRCLEGCELSYKTCSGLRYHLQDVHNILNDLEELTFTTKEEYTSWLTLIEKENTAQYILNTGVRRTATIEKMYLHCSRSGKSTCREGKNRSRQLKRKGTSKINSSCTSQVIVTKDLENGTYQVKFYKQHYAHKMEIQHLRLTKEEKASVAAKLIEGVSSDRVLDAVRDNISEDVKRLDLITKKDINNISKSYNINIVDGCRHSDVAINVNLWVQECQSQEDNPVLYHKLQGDESPDTVLNKDDFCLILMTNVQKDMLCSFGSNVICVDGIHGLNSYDFEITTILIKDEFNEGFPVAHMFTNSKDTEVYKLFFSKIRDHSGTINCATFMTDITTVYVDAWCGVMGPVKNHLYCSWYVDEAWHENLTKVTNEENRKWVYETLKTLQKEPDTDKFNADFDIFLLLLDIQKEKEMLSYLQKNYKNITEKWAHCHRLYFQVDTNMNVETMHRVIKYEYLEGKRIKRLDKTLNALCKFNRDRTALRLTKLTKGKNNSQSIVCYKEHQKGASSNYQIDIIDEKSYTVWDGSNKFTITCCNKNDQCCQIRCRDCNICLHSFKCTCEDYSIKTIICSHVHFLCIKYKLNTTQTQTTNSNDNKQISDVVNNVPVNNTNVERSEYITKIKEYSAILLDKIENEHSVEVLSHVFKTIEAATNIVKMSSKSHQNHFPQIPSKNQPHSTKLDKQKFFSTKKKHKTNSWHHYLNTTSSEKIIIYDTLTQNLFVSSIATDHAYTK